MMMSSSGSSAVGFVYSFFVNNINKIDKMADLVRNLLLLSFIALMSFAASDVTVHNMKCEMACALKYDQVSFRAISCLVDLLFAVHTAAVFVEEFLSRLRCSPVKININR